MQTEAQWRFEDQPNVAISRATIIHINRKEIAYFKGIAINEFFFALNALGC